jgi:prolyl oligopeptidase
LNAPNKRIVKYDLSHPEKGFQEVVPETKDVLDSLDIVDNNKLVLVYLQDVKVNP